MVSNRQQLRAVAGIVLLAALLGGALLGLLGGRDRPPAVVRFSAEEVRELWLGYGEAELQLQREDGTWWVLRPEPRRPARGDRVMAALSELSAARRARTVTAQAPERSERYGLDQANRLTLRVRLRDGTAHELTLGSDAEEGTYYREPEGEGVALSDRALRRLLPDELAHYLERRVFPEGIEPGRIRRLQVDAPGDRYELQYERFESWLAPERELQPHAPEVRVMLAALDRLNGDDLRNVGELQLDDPDARVSAVSDTGRRYELELHILDHDVWAVGRGPGSLPGGFASRLHPDDVVRVLRPLRDLAGVP